MDFIADRAWIDLDVIVNLCEFAKEFFRNLAVSRNNDLAGLGIHHIQRNFLVEKNVGECSGKLLVQVVFALAKILHDHFLLPFRLRGSHFGACDLLFRGNLHVHNYAVGSRRNCHRGVLYIRSFFAEDCA